MSPRTLKEAVVTEAAKLGYEVSLSSHHLVIRRHGKLVSHVYRGRTCAHTATRLEHKGDLVFLRCVACKRPLEQRRRYP